eukprot:scaffold25766_cov58-Phaeocystis_antarctica.AAC.1
MVGSPIAIASITGRPHLVQVRGRGRVWVWVRVRARARVTLTLTHHGAVPPLSAGGQHEGVSRSVQRRQLRGGEHLVEQRDGRQAAPSLRQVRAAREGQHEGPRCALTHGAAARDTGRAQRRQRRAHPAVRGRRRR